MSKHTLGPWLIQPGVFETGIAISPLDSKLIVAEVWPMEADRAETIEEDITAQANARVIATAPELLQALEAICEYWDEAAADGQGTPLSPDALIGGHSNECEPITIHNLLTSLIAKANGGAA